MNSLLPLIITLLIVALVIRGVVMRQLRSACRAGAEKILRDVTLMFDDEHVYRPSRPDDFPELDPSGYEAVRSFAATNRFRSVGALEDLTVSQANPEHRTRIDGYVSEDGAIGMAAYTLKGIHVVDLTSTFPGQRFLVTTNAEANKFSAPPTIERETLPASTTATELLARHRARLAEHLAQKPGMPVVPFQGFEDMLKTAREMTGAISIHRRSIGYLTEDELRQIGAGQPPYVVKLVWEEFTKLRDQRAA